MRRIKSGTLILALAAVLLAFGGPAYAQDMFDQTTNPKATRPTLNQSLGWRYDLPARSANRDDEVVAREYAVGLSAPLFGGKDFGAMALPSYDYLELSNKRHTLPGKLVGTGLAAFGYTTVQPGNVRFCSYLQGQIKSDTGDVRLSDAQYLVSLFALVPVNEQWYFTPGWGYVSDVAVGFLEKIPIPSAEVIYTPSPEFKLAFGTPFNGFTYRPYSWLEITAINLAAVLGEVTVRHRVNDYFSVREFYGTTSDVWNLSNDRYPERARIFERGMRVGAMATFEIPGLFELSARYEYSFQKRWVIGRTMQVDVVERIDLNPGQTLALIATVKF